MQRPLQKKEEMRRDGKARGGEDERGLVSGGKRDGGTGRPGRAGVERCGRRRARSY